MWFEQHETKTRLRTMFGFRIGHRSPEPPKFHLVYDSGGAVSGCVGKDVHSPSTVVPGREAGQGNYLIDFLLRHYTGATALDPTVKCLEAYEVSVEEFKSLKLPDHIHIQDESSSRKVTNNSLVLLPGPAAPVAPSAANAATLAETPDLAEVVRIYRVTVGPADEPIEHALCCSRSAVTSITWTSSSRRAASRAVSLLTGWVPRTHSSSSTFATSSIRHSSAQTLAISTRMAAFARSWSSASTGRGSTSDW